MGEQAIHDSQIATFIALVRYLSAFGLYPMIMDAFRWEYAGLRSSECRMPKTPISTTNKEPWSGLCFGTLTLMLALGTRMSDLYVYVSCCFCLVATAKVPLASFPEGATTTLIKPK